MVNIFNNMQNFKEYKIKAEGVKSLCWKGDDLVDWVGGGVIYPIDRKYDHSHRLSYPYRRFDSAIMSPSGKYSVIYEKRGTKALLLQGHEILRELNRSYYHACTYNYPITFIQLKDGREILAHCPTKYCLLEFEDVLSGQLLTSKDERNPWDIFHSNLTTSPSGRFLLNAGWRWHPWEQVFIYEVESALDDPKKLDADGILLGINAEVYGGAFLDDQTVLLMTSSEILDEDEEKI